jgi:hypothetical protein
MVKVSMEVRSGAVRFDVGVQAESIQRTVSFVERYYCLPSVTATLEHPSSDEALRQASLVIASSE